MTRQHGYDQSLLAEQKIKIATNPQEAIAVISLKPKDKGWGPDPPEEKKWKQEDAMFLYVRIHCSFDRQKYIIS